MQITEEDLKDIIGNENFKEEDKNILIDFCNSFQQMFSNFVDRDEFLNRISTLKKIEYTHRGEKADASYSQNGTLTINDDVHESKRKAIIYHELMHLVSMHLPRENPEFGKVQGLKIGSEDMNEIMTEYFTTRLLLHEGIEDLKGKYYIKNEDGIEEYVEHDGTGYISVAKLGEMYHKIFGQEIVDGYFNNATKFQENFNKKYQFLEDSEFTAMENAVYLSGNVYKNYGNALRIFMTNENEKLNSGNLSIYEYLKDSKLIRDCLPIRKNTKLKECTVTGIPSGVEKYLMRLDERFVAKFIRPDVVGKQQDDDSLRKKKEFFIALNAIRDNIEHLSPEDINNIDMNFQYEPDGSNIKVLVNGKTIEVFTDGETYLGTNEIRQKQIENVDDRSLIEQCIEISKGMSINDKGGNKECFIIDEYALLKTNGINEKEIQQLMKIDKQLKAKGVNIATTLDYKTTDKDSSKEYREGYILQEKANGKPLHENININKLDENQMSQTRTNYITSLQNLKMENQEFYDKFISDWIEITKAGLRVDPSKTNNFYYEKGNQMNFIDLNVASKIPQNIDLNQVCNEILVVLADGAKYNNPTFNKNSKVKEDANKLLAPIFRKVASTLNREGLSYNEIVEIVNNRFPDIEFDAKDGPEQAIEPGVGKTQEHIKDSQQGGLPREQISNIQNTIISKKVPESDVKEELQEIKSLMELKRLRFKEKTGQQLTEEEKRLLEENERRINQTQVNYRKSIDSEKKKYGLSM